VTTSGVIRPGYAIGAAGVGKRFRRFHERPTSVKQRFTRFRSTSEEFWALRDVDLEVREGAMFGLIGHNGSGKTTLLKIIGGILRPNEGRVVSRGRIAALLELGAGFHPELTGRENVYLNASILGLSRKETDRIFDDVVAFAELEEFIDNQVKFYSSGMFVRLGFAVAVHVDPAVLLVDEVLAVGDEAFQRKCLDRVRQFQREGRTILFVTHAVDLVRQICDEAVMLDHGRIHASGNPEEVVRRFRQENLRYQVEEGRQWGTREMEIVSADLIREAGATDTPVRPGEALIVQADVRSPSPVEDVVAVMALYDHENRTIFRANTGVLGVPIDPFEGKRRIRFRILSVPMARGRYSVTVAVHSRDERRIYHVWEEALSFEVRHEGYDPGEVFTPVEVEVEEL
jgi:ABC-type polysaccharide/polyol phosphate transport system ATPase subunit